MRKGIIIGIIVIIIGVTVLVSLGSNESDITEIEPTENPIINESSVEDIIPEKRSIKINLSDGIGAGDR